MYICTANLGIQCTVLYYVVKCKKVAGYMSAQIWHLFA